MFSTNYSFTRGKTNDAEQQDGSTPDGRTYNRTAICVG